MFFWSSFLDLIRVVLFSLGHVCGGSLGGGIIMLSLLVRLALLPLTFRLALRAARFLWIGDLSRPDALVASVAAGLAGAAVVAGPSSGSSKVAAALAAATTFLIAWRLSAGVGLYWVASNVVGVVQSLLVRRT